MKIKLRSIRSNLDLNPFPGIALRVDSAIRKEFHVYSFRRGWNLVPRSHIGAQKNDNRPIFGGSRFLSSGSFDLACSIIFKPFRCFQWLVEQDGHIPTRRVIRCQGNLHFEGVRHSDEAKDLKWRLKLGPSVQIWIWGHFRGGLFE